MKTTGTLVALVVLLTSACGSPPEASDVDKDFLQRRESVLQQLNEAHKAMNMDSVEVAPAAINFAHKVRELRDIIFTGPESKKLEQCRDRTWGFFDKLKDITEPLAELTKMAKREKSGKPLRTGEDPIPNEEERQWMAARSWDDINYEVQSIICQLYDVSTSCKKVADKLKAGVGIDTMTRSTLNCP